MSNTTSNGRKKSLRALVVAGNKNGLAGTSVHILYRRYSMEYEPTLNFSESILKKPARFFFFFFFLTISGLSL